MPRTPAPIEASRRNGAKSKGPVTPEGKARLGRDALKHGLTSRVVVLTSESPAAFDALLELCIDKYRPADIHERGLVEELAVSLWRLNRVLGLETTTIDLEIDRQRPTLHEIVESIDPAGRTSLAVAALTTGHGPLHWYSRQEGRLRRAIRDARAQLEKCKIKPGPDSAAGAPTS